MSETNPSPAAGSIRATLPASHAPLLGPFFDRPAIREPRATCESCAMCDHGGQQAGAVFFEPDVKCCTYFPTLPNYLVGAVFADPSSDLDEGRRRLRERIATRFGVTPMWLGPPRKYRVLMEAARGTSFGRSTVLLCPYFDGASGGRCTIWRHRESICSTFFCKHDSGAAGWAFWDALKQYLGHVEVRLARSAAMAVSPNTTEPETPRLRLTRDDLEDRPPGDEEYARYWAEWVGREVDFYVACYEHVRRLPPGEIVRLVDEAPRGRELLQALTEKYEAIASPKLAERLILNKDIRTSPMPSGIGVRTYSNFDTFVLSDDLWAVLQFFQTDERVQEIVDRLAKEHEVEVPEDLLMKLQQHEVLVPPATPRNSTP